MTRHPKRNRLRPTALALLTAASAVFATLPAAAQVTFYENDDYSGRSFTTQRPVANFANIGFNDRASSVVVGQDRWEVCEDARYQGRCVVLRRGSYPSLRDMGLNDRVSSAHLLAANVRITDERYAPTPVVTPDFRRRRDERLFQANVTNVRAVVGAPEQRCWMEREQVSQGRSSANVPGAVLGAVLGGVLGHQIGGGTGRDIATVGGVVAGGAIGANVGRDGQRTESRDVQRCENVDRGTARPAYWDVTYVFRGTEHHMQTTSPPGATVTVNRQGEPRV